MIRETRQKNRIRQLEFAINCQFGVGSALCPNVLTQSFGVNCLNGKPILSSTEKAAHGHVPLARAEVSRAQRTA